MCDSAGYLRTLHRFYDAEQRYVGAGGATVGADFSEMATFFHSNVVARQGPTVPFAGDWHGLDGIQRFFAAFSETWSTLELGDTRYFEGETGVAVTMRMRATARSTGKQLDTWVGHFFGFEDEVIREITVFYLDPVEVVQVTLP